MMVFVWLIGWGGGFFFVFVLLCFGLGFFFWGGYIFYYRYTHIYTYI